MEMEMEMEVEMEDSSTELPGFRFHPTEEELLDFYLKNMIFGKKLRCDIIGFLNIYHHNPWELPGLARIGEREWYFFVPRSDRRRKQGSGSGGGRPNRTTETGFWKATGSDRKILSLSRPKRMIGLKKTLVFYKGRAPHGCKTDWVMNEYRLPPNSDSDSDSDSPQKDHIVLCKIFRKATSLKVLEQRAAMEEEGVEMKTVEEDQYSSLRRRRRHHLNSLPPLTPPMDIGISFCSQQAEHYAVVVTAPMETQHAALSKEDEDDELLVQVIEDENKRSTPPPPPKYELGTEEEEEYCCKGTTTRTRSSTNNNSCLKLAELQVPTRFSMDWNQDSFWTQQGSPWLDNLITTPSPYANVLNF